MANDLVDRASEVIDLVIVGVDAIATVAHECDVSVVAITFVSNQ